MDTTLYERTRKLLEEHRAGDRSALGQLLELHYEAIRQAVSRSLNTDLRKEGETGDYVHQIVVDTLRRGPKFIISDPMHFRNLLACIVKHKLIDVARFRHAEMRAPRNQRRLPTRISIIDLDICEGASKPPTQPDEAAQRSEEREFAELAMEMLPPDERHIIDLRLEGVALARIGDEFGISLEGARKRHGRALAKWRCVVMHLMRRDIDGAIRAAGDGK
ncbi:MAG: hypothetical protein DHS20C21_24230 [Gemmatimonadota bacterium]|nr:MAG: hypothetical protein DHS20C21_24230 [Gemmatimonadota bacterium]